MSETFTEPEESTSQISILSVPFEVMEHILKHASTSKDILNFALASKDCYSHALQMLYRKVDWVVGHTYPQKCAAALHGMEFLLAYPDLFSAVRSLRVSERRYEAGSDTKLPLDFSRFEMPIQPARKVGSGPLTREHSFPQTFHTTNTVLAILPRFTGLTELTLRSVSLPRTFYQSVHVLSDAGLRVLTLRHVRPTTRYPRGYDPATLRLTEISIFSAHTKLPKLKALLKLARIPTLRTLRLDRTLERALGSLAAHGLPPSVRSLELDFRGASSSGHAPFELLFFFLNSCRYVRHLELADMGKLDGIEQYPMRMRLAFDALPSLTSITVPVGYLDLLLPGRAIDSLTITDGTIRETSTITPLVRFLRVDDISDILKTLQKASVSLQSLKFNLRVWDKELFYMLAARQRNLKELHVAYQYGEITDEFFMTLGNLIELPKLERLHLYRFGDKMAGTDDDNFVDQKEYMVIWPLYMPNLREVALSPDVVWTKSPGPPRRMGRRSKPTWSRFAVEPMDGVEGLVVIPCPKEAKKYEALGKERRLFHRDLFASHQTAVFHGIGGDAFHHGGGLEYVVPDDDGVEQDELVQAGYWND
ncbi:hypothetical protein EW145_g2976 [Phellinidium pouzarii]|uniref:F-box domain-containing protein n=1 Tax=Phellinidium pouzarii TaxID=167371 RepID=A0A4S4L927_9AGAM|nr:hypothetical protein EW145_g2976 [Phellinidium pouzarii]